MSNELVSALISGNVALVVSAIAYATALRRLLSETQRHERELQRRLTEKLIDLRLPAYREAFEITDALTRSRLTSDEANAAYLNQVADDLAEWNRSSAALVMSYNAIGAYRKLRDLLHKGARQSRMDKETREAIWHGKNKFRGALRADVQLLHAEESDEADSVNQL